MPATAAMAEREDGEIIEHHVDEEMEKKLPRRLLEGLAPSDREGPGSTQSSHRLLAYSDALLSIIATVMILPVAHTKFHDDEELKESIQLLLTTKVGVYLMTFLIVTVAWAAHIRSGARHQTPLPPVRPAALIRSNRRSAFTFQAVSGHRAHRRLPRPAQLGLHDDYNLPPVHSESSPHGITFSLMATFPDHIMGLLLFCGCVMVIGLIQSIIVVYGFSRPFLLNSQIQISENQAFYKRHILKVIMRVPVVCLFASIFSFVFFQLSYVILAVVVFLPYISQCLSWCRTKLFGRPAEEAPDSLLFYTYHPNEPLSKERVEAFSDGVYAIVATLLILDICEDNVPDPGTVQRQFNGSLTAALQVYGPEFLAYFGSFATVGLLWFVHHSLFLHVTKATRSMGLLNTFSLAFVGGLPLAYELTHEFPRNSHNELEAVQTSCVIIFFAGIFQLAIWVVALFSERETLHPYVRYGGPDHTFMLAKLSLYPCVALATFFLTCILSQFSAPIFHLMEITVPFAFLLLRLLVRVAMAVLRALFRPATAIEDDEDSRLPFNDLVT
ncbi:endosomal/lysosomal proton channel TMEM175 isoform X2 [Denticeps clupeoides]|uniref:endosomal/lysosomal proton channel TMEM175 isoform X2 n=1 Tax=Denticeps clupeoides TaxID=299321 RepID=UPI0010A53BB9|nr:endosomal/lysosomal potassium channel TMEM175 isoform X2 [Denticeps clupeoides]